MRQHNIRNVPDDGSLFKWILGAVTDVSTVTCCFIRSCAAKNILKFLGGSADSKNCRISRCLCGFVSYDTTQRRLPNPIKRTLVTIGSIAAFVAHCFVTLV